MNGAPWFGWPAGVPVLFMIPVLWLLLERVDALRHDRLQRQLGRRMNELAPEDDPRRLTRRRRLVAAGLLAALIALLQPLLGVRSTSQAEPGLDVMVCLDVSRSMLAQDLAPSRLERAREEIQQLTARLEGQRIGLVAFAGEARLVVPLTRDLDSFLEMLAEVDPYSVLRGGTDLGAALRTAQRGLASSGSRHGVIFLISDGEDLEGRGAAVAQECRVQGIPVHTVGMGSERGSKIPMDGEPGFLRDELGEEVITAMDPTGLQNIAAVAGGTFLDAGPMVEPLVQLYDRHVSSVLGTAPRAGSLQEPVNRFQWPLLVAILVWLFELARNERRKNEGAAAHPAPADR